MPVDFPPPVHQDKLFSAPLNLLRKALGLRRFVKQNRTMERDGESVRVCITSWRRSGEHKTGTVLAGCSRRCVGLKAGAGCAIFLQSDMNRSPGKNNGLPGG